MKILGMTEASSRLRIHYNTLRRWCEAGKVRPIRDSAGRRLFKAEDIDALAAELRRELTHK